MIVSLLGPLPNYAKSFFKQDFKPSTYVVTAVFLAICIGINYTYDFESNFVFQENFYARVCSYMLFYGFAYIGGVAIVSLTDSRAVFIRNKRFWLLAFAGILVLSIDGSFRGTYDIAWFFFDSKEARFMGRLLFELKNFFLLFLPLFFLWKLIAKKGDSFFGLTTKDVSIRPYLFILLLMLPVLILVGDSPDFLSTYPKFRTYNVEQYWGINKYWLALPFESFYGLSFMNVELFFRGFLVIGLARLMGTHCVLPMVCMYAFLHFEKPLAETIGSVFGGLLLGAFAYQSKNIWGGVIVHAGIALMMEVVAVLYKA